MLTLINLFLLVQFDVVLRSRLDRIHAWPRYAETFRQGMDRATVYLAVSLLDRCLAITTVPPDGLFLLACACFFAAANYNEVS